LVTVSQEHDPSADAVGHLSDVAPPLSDVVDQRSGAISDVVFCPSNTGTETIPMWGAANYEVAGSGLDGAAIGQDICLSSSVVYDVIGHTTTATWGARSAAVLGLPATSAIKAMSLWPHDTRDLCLASGTGTVTTGAASVHFTSQYGPW